MEFIIILVVVFFGGLIGSILGDIANKRKSDKSETAKRDVSEEIRNLLPREKPISMMSDDPILIMENGDFEKLLKHDHKMATKAMEVLTGSWNERLDNVENKIKNEINEIIKTQL